MALGLGMLTKAAFFLIKYSKTVILSGPLSSKMIDN